MANDPSPKKADLVWRLVTRLQGVDYGWFLPLLGRLPLWLGYGLSSLRARLHAALQSDWRSISLGYRHVFPRCGKSYSLLFQNADQKQIHHWQIERFLTEARYHYECSLLIRTRVAELSCNHLINRNKFFQDTAGRGLLLISPHFDSFFLGIPFLGLLFQAVGRPVNMMTSSVVQDPRIHHTIRAFYADTFRALEPYLNGGKVIDMEGGSKPFMEMLNRGEVVIMAGDAPALHYGSVMQIEFLGAERVLAGGVLRMALKTASQACGFVCRFLGPGKYEMEFTAVHEVVDASSLAAIYRFFSDAIYQEPGKWWASDLLLEMPPVASEQAQTNMPTDDAGATGYTGSKRKSIVLLGDSWFDGKWKDRIGSYLSAALGQPVINNAVGGSTSGAPLGATGGNNILVTLAPGCGDYTVGETVTQGGTTATVWTWTAATRSLVLINSTGTFDVGQTITGSRSGAAGTVASVQDYGLRGRVAGDIAAAGGAANISMAIINIGANDKIAGVLSGSSDKLATANTALYANLRTILGCLTGQGIFCVLIACVDFQIGDFDVGHVFTYPPGSPHHWDVRFGRTIPFRDDPNYQTIVDDCHGKALLVAGAMSALFNNPSRWIDFSGNSQGVHPTVEKGYNAGIPIPSTPAIPVPAPGQPGVPETFAGYASEAESGYQVFADILISAIAGMNHPTI